MTAIEISNLLGIQQQNVRKHLKDLLRGNYIKTVDYAKYKSPIYFATKPHYSASETRLNSILETPSSNPSISTREVSQKVGLSKEQTLLYLRKLESNGLTFHKAGGRTFYWCLNENRGIE